MPRRLVIHDFEWLRARSKDNENGCWEWTGVKTHKGYGVVMTNIEPRKHFRAHRYMWALRNGPIPEGRQVLHKCDNPGCINPEHLYLGTNADNMRDKTERGRGTKPPRMVGEHHPQRKLTWIQVKAIRHLCANGTPQKVVAKQFGISLTVANKIVLGKLWREECAS